MEAHLINAIAEHWNHADADMIYPSLTVKIIVLMSQQKYCTQWVLTDIDCVFSRLRSYESLR